MKKTKGKSLALILTFLTVLLTFSISVKAETPADKLKYTVKNGEAYITGYTGEASELIIPSSIDGVRVTRIDNLAFQNCTQLKKVIIPDTVTEIGRYAFQDCVNLESIDIPESTVNFETGVFYNCKSLTSVKLPANTTEISPDMFCRCEVLPEIEIPDKVKKIGTGAFYMCKALKTFVMPDSVKSLGRNIFINCENLEYVKLSNNVDSIQNDTFCICQNLKKVDLPKKIKFIGSRAFYRCVNLEEINIPEDVLIKNKVFFGCEKLKDVIDTNYTDDTYPKREISPEGFEYVMHGNEAEIIGYLGDDESVEIPGEINGAKVTKIGKGSFFCCVNMKEIIIPDTVNYIERYTFHFCINLKSVKIPDSVTKIEDGIFYGCHSLEEADISENITVITEDMFHDCINLQRISLSDNITEIQKKAFNYCGKLNDIEFNSGIKKIGDSAFVLCEGLEKITVPDSVSNIGKSAFGGCINLKSFSFSNKTVINSGALAGSVNLEEINYRGYWNEWNKTGIILKNESFPKLCVRCIPEGEMLGDINLDGKIDIDDVTEIQKYIAFKTEFSERQIKAADLLGDGIIDIRTATNIGKKLLTDIL